MRRPARLLLCLLLLPLAACEERAGVVSYEVSAPAAYDWPVTEATGDGAEGFEWQVPAGFVASPDVPESLLGDYRAAGSDEALPLRLTVSMMPGDGGGMPANVQRWMGQLMFRPPADPSELVHVTPVLPHPANGALWIVRIRGQFSNPHVPTSMLAAIVTVLDPSGRPVVTWFFKLTGDPEATEASLDAFVAMVYSLRTKGTPMPDLDALPQTGADPHAGVPGLPPMLREPRVEPEPENESESTPAPERDNEPAPELEPEAETQPGEVSP